MNTTLRSTTRLVSPDMADNIAALPLLSTSLPIRFRNGNTITHLDTNCARCGKLLGSKTIRGSLQLIADGASADIKAYALCYDCRTTTPVEAKLHNDGTVIYRRAGGWACSRWEAHRTFGMVATGCARHRWQQLLPPVLALGGVLLWCLSR